MCVFCRSICFAKYSKIWCLARFGTFVQLKKREKQPWRGINFGKVAGWSQSWVNMEKYMLLPVYSSFHSTCRNISDQTKYVFLSNILEMLSLLGCGITRHGTRVQEKNLQYILNNFIITVFRKIYIKASTMIILRIFMIYQLSKPWKGFIHFNSKFHFYTT